jgi:hypothetical protein
MPKIEFIDPKEERKSTFIEFDPIPVNQYQKTIKDEKDHFTHEELVNIYRDMAIIREFETMLNQIRSAGSTMAFLIIIPDRRTFRSVRKLQQWEWPICSTRMILSLDRTGAMVRFWQRDYLPWLKWMIKSCWTS